MSSPSDPMILHKTGIRSVMLLSEIYNPLTDGAVEFTNKQIPAVGTLVVNLDNTSYPRLGFVSAVDEETYASTVSPLNLMSGGESNQLLSFGNDILYVYLDNSGDAPWRLILDSKLVAYGDTPQTFTIFRVLEDGSEAAINYVSAEDDTQLVPLTDVGTTGYKTFTDSVTGTIGLEEGDVLIVRVFDVLDVVCGEIKVTLKMAQGYGELSYIDDPIVAMVVLPEDINQTDAEGNAVVYRGQPISELSFTPKLVTAGGEYIPLSETVGDQIFMVYGREDVDTDVAGMSYNLTLKHFLPDNFATPLVDYVGSNRALVLTLTVTVYDQDVDTVLKLVPIPYVSSGSWALRWIRSVISRTEIPAATVAITVGAFDPALRTTQSLTVTFTETDQYGVDAVFTEELSIRVGEPTDGSFAINLDPDGLVIYGVSGSGIPLPTIRYNAVGTFWFDATDFPDPTTLVAVCYTRAFPPKLATEAVAPTPTHFRLVDAASGTALSAITSLSAINSGVTTTDTDPSALGVALATRRTVAIEWLRQVDSSYLYLITTPLLVDVTEDTPA